MLRERAKKPSMAISHLKVVRPPFRATQLHILCKVVHAKVEKYSKYLIFCWKSTNWSELFGFAFWSET